jgi:Kef-type K+ transport system membrane component KefB
VSAALILIVLVVVAYLAAHVAFDWLARRFLIVSGVEYLVLGVLLGPQVADVLSADMLESFAPITTLALGWIGAIVGMQFTLRDLVLIKGQQYRVAFFEATTTLAVVMGLQMLLLAWLFDIPMTQAAIPAFALGAIAVTSTPSGIEVVARTLSRRGPIVRQLEITTAIDAFVAVVAMGLLMCLANPGGQSMGRSLTTTEWVAVMLGIGVIGGALFHLFLGTERHIDRIFISLAGAIILTSGAASYLGVSPLFPAMIVGIMLANTSDSRHEIQRTLGNAERPFYFVLLIVAGASWQPGLVTSFLPVVLFLIARAAGKVGGARLGARINEALPLLGPDWGRALLGHGGLALALALDYTQHDRLIFPNIVFTAAIVSVLLTDLSSARLVQSVVAPLTDRARHTVVPRPAPAEPPSL